MVTQVANLISSKFAITQSVSAESGWPLGHPGSLKRRLDSFTYKVCSKMRVNAQWFHIIESCYHKEKSSHLKNILNILSGTLLKKKNDTWNTYEIEPNFTSSLQSLSEFLSIVGHSSHHCLNNRIHSGHTCN